MGQCVARLRSCAAALGRRDDHVRERDPGHHPVAHRELLTRGAGVGQELRDDRALACQTLLEISVLRWVAVVHAGADDRDRAAAVLECGVVRGGVDPGGETPDTTVKPLSTSCRAIARAFASAFSKLPAADHGHGSCVGRCHGSGDEQHRRAVMDGPQVLGISRVERGQRPDAGALFPAPEVRPCLLEERRCQEPVLLLEQGDGIAAGGDSERLLTGSRRVRSGGAQRAQRCPRRASPGERIGAYRRASASVVDRLADRRGGRRRRACRCVDDRIGLEILAWIDLVDGRAKVPNPAPKRTSYLR